MSDPNLLLSAELRAVADALRHVRSRLVRMVANGTMPEWAWPDATTVQVIGLDVANALERLARDDEPSKTPTHLDERR